MEKNSDTQKEAVESIEDKPELAGRSKVVMEHRDYVKHYFMSVRLHRYVCMFQNPDVVDQYKVQVFYLFTQDDKDYLDYDFEGEEVWNFERGWSYESKEQAGERLEEVKQR